jgi:hypothetical protein
MKQNWSRRELEAFGEPLGDSVTQRKLGGGYICGGGGGKGGGGGGQAPAQQSVGNTTIPEYARPYVETMLGKSSALTDINQNPYQNYGGQRIAGFNPTQQKAFQEAINRKISGQLGTATGLAGAAGRGSLGIAGQMAGAGQQYANQATDAASQQAYMSPYIQNALQPQLQEMQRQYEMTGLQQRKAAAGSGAFGGNREALMRSENERNKNMAMNQAIGSGYQNAFQAAQQAQQFGANLGLQGYQGALSGLGQAGQAASVLGQLGQTQFGQESALNAERQKIGAIQQAQAQQGLDLSYQDFLKQKNYPYQQLAFMSDMLRGIPLSQQSQSIYSAPPNMGSQLGGLGMSALGIYGASGGFKANGGMVGKGYAEGGLMAAKRYKEGGYADGGDITMMNVQQLTEMLDNPSLSPLEVEMVQKRIMLLTRMENNPATAEIMGAGIGAIPTGDMVPEEGMAGGGIVAFAKGGKSEEDYRTFLESQVRKSIENQMSGDAFNRSAEDKAKVEQGIKERQDNRMYELMARIGAATAAGTSQYGLSNLGAGVNEGAKAYTQLMDKDTADRMKLLDAQLYADKAEDARRSSLTGQMQTTLGTLYGRDAALAAARANAGDPELKALQKAQALINNDDQIPALVKQREMETPGSPRYNAYTDAINSIRKSYFDQVGIKRPYVAPANVQFPAEPEKQGLFDRIFGSSKTETPKAKVVPFNQLPS